MAARGHSRSPTSVPGREPSPCRWLLDGVRWLSITRWAGAITQEVPDDITLVEGLGPGYAAAATAVVIVFGTWLTGQRLRAFNLTGDE